MTMRPLYPQGVLAQMNLDLAHGQITPDEYRERLRALPTPADREYFPRIGQAGRKRWNLSQDVWDTLFQQGPLTAREIARVLQVDSRSVSMSLQHLYRARRVSRSGEGGIASPFVYRAVT